MHVLAVVCHRTEAQGCGKETESERYLEKKGWGQFMYPKWFCARVWAKPLVIPRVRKAKFPKRDSRDCGVTPVLPAPRRFKKGQTVTFTFSHYLPPSVFSLRSIS